MHAMQEPVASQTTIDCLRQLIGFDTTSRNSNLALIDWAEAHLSAQGARVRRDYNHERTKANLFATFGEGPGGVVLSGHSDVVPVDGQAWSSDPFLAEIRDGKLYGRGACDMKGFIAVVLGKAERFAQANLRAPIHVALSYDEEAGCLGIPGLLADLQRAGIRPDGCIVGEPTSMQLVTAHKGGRIYRCRVHGHAAHSSLTPQGLNAIEYAARMITFIQDLSWREEERGLRVEGLDVPFSTISTNTIAGGNGRNIVPAECEFYFDYRYVPGMAPDAFIEEIRRYVAEQVEPRMKRRHPAAGVELDCTGDIPALNDDEQGTFTRLARSLQRPHASAKVAYGTEAGFFQRAGIPAIVCGPGSIDNAHKPDEFVPLTQLAQCELFIDKLVEKSAALEPA
ncbi:MAG: acetylornithine deacetylase [Burkholderiaceae bacterium]